MKLHNAVLASGLLAFVAVGAARADDPPAATPPAAGEKIKLVLAPHAGDRFATEVKVHNEQTVMGMEMVSDSNMLIVTVIDSVAADGAFSLKNNIQRVWGKSGNPMTGDIEFDTDQPVEKAEEGDPAAAAKQMVLQTMSGMVGKDIVVQVAADGTVKIDGAGAPDGVPNSPTGVGKFPDKPVGVGDAWDSEVTNTVQGMPITSKTKLKNTIKSMDADTVTIEQTGTVELSGAEGGAGQSENPMAAAMSKLKTKSSSLKGVVRLSRKDGMQIGAETDTEMELTLGDAGGEGNPMAGMSFVTKGRTTQERKAAPPESEMKKPPAPAKEKPPGEGAAPPPVVPPTPEEKK